MYYLTIQTYQLIDNLKIDDRKKVEENYEIFTINDKRQSNIAFCLCFSPDSHI